MKMQKGIKGLFTNDIFFLIISLLSFILGLIGYIITKIHNNTSIIAQIIFLFIVISTYVSYRRHDKNIMKGLMGAILISIIYDSFMNVSYMNDSLINYICVPLYIICSIVLFINHFIINSDHKALSMNVFVNQITSLVLLLVLIIYRISTVVVTTDLLNIISIITILISNCCSILVIICIESRLDLYKIKREENKTN